MKALLLAVLMMGIVAEQATARDGVPGRRVPGSGRMSGVVVAKQPPAERWAIVVTPYFAVMSD
jgi:hypothetical protein